MPVSPVPQGFHTVTPYLFVRDVPRLLDFLAAAFGAVELDRTVSGSGRVMHALVRIGDSMVSMGEANDRFPAAPASLLMYVPDTDAVYRQALAAGGVSILEPTDQFYGDRNAGVLDPGGNSWWIATRLEDVPPEEMARRAAARS